jgi:hypothetical protein
MTLNDIRHKDPLREAIDTKTVVFDDITDLLLESSAELSRFELYGESRFATKGIRKLRELKKTIELFERRWRDEQLRINKALNPNR